MRLIINETKKIFSLKHLFITVIIFFFLSFMFPGNFNECVLLIDKFDTENYPEQIPLDFSKYSVEKKFNDMLLEKYGTYIDNSELPLVQKQFHTFFEQLKGAAQNDDILIRNGIILGEDLSFYSIYESDNAPDISESDQQYIWECTNGVRQLDKTDYPIYFAGALKRIIDYMDNQNGVSENVYHILSKDIISGIEKNLQIILWATIAGMFLIIPYMVEERRSNINLFEYTSKVGRKSYVNKIIAVAFSAFFVICVGVICSLVLFFKWNISQYYDCNISTLLYMDKNISYSNFLKYCYSEFSLLEAYFTLLLGLLLFGIIVIILTAIVSYHFDNIISAYAVNSLSVVSLAVFFRRYVSYGLSFESGVFTTKYELYLAIIIVLILLTSIILRSTKRKKFVEV